MDGPAAGGPDPRELLQLAEALADEADAIAMTHFGGRLHADTKADGSPVTIADRAIERALRARLADRRPADAVLGEEEGGTVDPEVPTWVIDPIDATSNYLRGTPVFATLIAVVWRDQPIVGVASAPAMGERWTGTAGGVAARNGRPVMVSEVDDLRHAQVLHGGLGYFAADDRAWAALRDIGVTAARTRGFGDYWMHLLVAAGQAEAAIERDLSLWDVAAPSCIVTAAGGRVTGWDGGSPLTGGDVLASNGRVHGALLSRLASTAGRQGG